MARIKAKPMNRLPLPPVAGVKNGFRSTPPPAAVYDPTAFTPGQQRFVYANGTPGPTGSVPYANQVHVYVSENNCLLLLLLLTMINKLLIAKFEIAY